MNAFLRPHLGRRTFGVGWRLGPACPYLPAASLSGPSRLGSLGTQGIAAIIQGAVNVTLAAVQIAYTEYQERRARRQWERDQARIDEEREQELRRMEQQNAALRANLDRIIGGSTTSPTGSGTTTALSAPSWTPYALAGGGALLLVLLLRRKS